MLREKTPPEAAPRPDGLLLSINIYPNISNISKYIKIYPGINKTCQKNKVLGMKFSIVEMVPTFDDIIFKISPASQLPYNAKFKK